MIISDPSQLSALFSAMEVTKWEAGNDTTANMLFASPFFAVLYNTVVDEMTATDSSRSEEESDLWQSWRRLESHPGRLQLVKKHIANYGSAWNILPYEKRLEYINILISPFYVSDFTLEMLMRMKSGE
jgi:hypothetical protein